MFFFFVFLVFLLLCFFLVMLCFFLGYRLVISLLWLVFVFGSFDFVLGFFFFF